MSLIEDRAAWILGPQRTKIAVVAFTPVSSGTDISAVAQLGPDWNYRMVDMISSADVYYAWGTTTAPSTIDETVTVGDTRCFFLPAGVRISEYATAPVLCLKGATGNGLVRLCLSSPVYRYAGP